MPTVFRQGPYRFFFYSNEGAEPVHIHVGAAGKEAKFWLDPLRLAFSDGFRAHELGEIRGIIESNTVIFLEKWNEHFKGR